MKFKYYLRGIGMGVIFATLILTVAGAIHNNEMSDQEIIKRAEKLGMIMPETESEDNLFGGGSNSEADSESETKDLETTQTSITESTDSKSDTEEPKTEEKQTEEPTTEEPTTEEPETQKPPQHVEVTQYILHVVWGDYPRKIADELYKNGMVDDAKEFRNYLGDYCKQHKKDIRVGTYTITKGMTYEEISKIITKS